MTKVFHPKAFKDLRMDYSELSLLWFQDDFVMPIAADVLKKMEEIPFKEICGEFAYLM